MILVTAFKVAIAHGQLVKSQSMVMFSFSSVFIFHTSSKFFWVCYTLLYYHSPKQAIPFSALFSRSSPFRRFFPDISIKSVYQGLTKQSLLAIISNCRVLLQVHTLSRVAEDRPDEATATCEAGAKSGVC